MTEQEIHEEILALIRDIPEEGQAKRLVIHARDSVPSDPEIAMQYVHYVLENYTNPVVLHEAQLVLGECYFEKGRYKKAAKIYRECLARSEELNHPVPVALLHNRLGLTLWKIGEHEQALEEYFQALSYYTQIDDIKSIGDVENNIGLIYWDLKMIDEALRYYQQSLEKKIKLGDEPGIANLNNNIAGIYYRRGDLATAIEYMDPILEYFLHTDRYRELARAYNNKCLLLMDIKEYGQAREVIEKAIEIVEEKEYHFEKANCYITLGDLEMRLGHNDKAVVNYDRALEVAREVQSKELLRIVLGNQAQFYEEIGEPAKALEVFHEYEKLKDELFHEQFGAKIAELESRFETEKKEKEMEIYRLRNIELVKKNEEIEKQKSEIEMTLSQLQKAQQDIIDLERKASAMAMAVTANHEINQPLMVIQGNMDMLRMSLDYDRLSSKQRQYVTKIEESIDRISVILEKFKSKMPTRFTSYSSDTEMVEFDDDDNT